jgi:adenylate kinase
VEYENKTAMVADYYAQFDKVAKVKGEGTIENIFQSLCDQIEAKQPA